jgi:hypothetical protein
MKIRPLGAELFYVDRQRERQTHGEADMKKLTVASHDFAKAPNKSTRSQHNCKNNPSGVEI